MTVKACGPLALIYKLNVENKSAINFHKTASCFQLIKQQVSNEKYPWAKVADLNPTCISYLLQEHIYIYLLYFPYLLTLQFWLARQYKFLIFFLGPSEFSHQAMESYITTETHKCYALMSGSHQLFVVYGEGIPTYAMRYQSFILLPIIQLVFTFTFWILFLYCVSHWYQHMITVVSRIFMVELD